MIAASSQSMAAQLRGDFPQALELARTARQLGRRG
jgi:hypothetical protein